MAPCFILFSFFRTPLLKLTAEMQQRMRITLTYIQHVQKNCILYEIKCNRMIQKIYLFTHIYSLAKLCRHFEHFSNVKTILNKTCLCA